MALIQVGNEIIEVEDDDFALTTEQKEDRVRAGRNVLLEKTDWWAMSDRTMTQAEIDYRQALRDVPAQAGFPENITWPTKPE